MALTSDRKISILIIGTFLIGIIIGLFFARIQEESQKGDKVTFRTQSVGGAEVVVPIEEIACPRESEIRSGQAVIMDNPLVQVTSELFSFKQGIVSENYYLWGPSGATNKKRKGQLVEYPLDQVTAGVENNNGLCVYSSLGKDRAILRHDNIGEGCSPLSTPSFVGFSCPQSE